jgi:hypothetical protein
MAQPTNSFSSYDAVGNREDLINQIYMVEQTKTPFTSRIAKVTATTTNHEWQTDNLAAAVDSNAVIEGDDATTDASSPTTRLGNQTQISDKVARVTGTQQSVEHAGRSSEMAYQISKRMVELKRDIEKSALANKAKAVGSDTVARVAAGFESWIATNTSAGVGGSDPTGNGTNVRTDGTQRAFAESNLKSVLALCADGGGDPNLILTGSFNKQAASAFSGNGTKTFEGSSNTLNTAIDIYVSDFGTLEIVYSPFSRDRSALVVDTSLWAMATLPGRAFDQYELAKNGDTDRTQILTEWTLEARNEAGNGIVADLTVA